MRFLILCCFCLFHLSDVFCQSKTRVIGEIKKRCSEIDATTEEADFRSISFQDEGSLELEAVIYMDGQLPIKLITINTLDTGKEEKFFYFDKMGLMYVSVENTTFQRIPRWEEAKSQELGEAEFRDANSVKVDKHNFYFQNHKLIHWISESPNSQKDEVIIKIGIELLQEVENLMNRINN